MSIGWVCLHRGLLEWEWYNDINTCRLFVHCILRANHKPRKWRGIDIGIGQFWTSLPTLQSETGLSASQLRTSLNKLKSTGELTVKSHATGRMITVVEYNKYQSNDRLCDRPVTDQSQTNDRPVTANNNDNNENHVNNGTKKEVKPVVDLDYSSLLMSLDQIDELIRIRKQNKGGKITQRVISGIAKEFNTARAIGYTTDQILTEWEMRGWKSVKAEWLKPSGFNKNSLNESNVESLQFVTLENNTGLIT